MDSLGQELQSFVAKYEQGATRASDLVSKEALQMREVFVQETRNAKLDLSAHVTQTSVKFEQKFDNHLEQASRERLRERLLESLKYHGMNDRANQIDAAHASTFRWLFADEDGGSGRSDTDPSKPPEPVWSSFTDWLQSNLNMYWIMGKPGSGKSTLARFILSEPRTKATLEMWRHDAIIVSHYFWRPGALMQRSIKGMFCSIIYQLIFSIHNALEYASSNVAGLRQKDDDTDWSVPELERLCLGLIKHCGTPLCLFIDGLDECGPEDNHQKLLDTLDRIIRLPNVKVIASSRNEPIFEKRFRHEPQLRVQDLTAGDLRTYATDKLLCDIEDKIREELVENAEGVFLWLILAVQSINRGLSNGDSLSELHKRIRSLPRGLNDLYKDMWDRLNDDSDIYRQSAALYFKLALACDGRLSSRGRGWTPLEMMLASSATSHVAFVRPTLVSASQLLKECEESNKRVQVRCAGFLGLCGKPIYHPLQQKLGDAERALLEYADATSTFQFVHRSARDFLVDTVEGQNILRQDNTSSEDINIRCISAGLRALELLDPILGDEAQTWYPCTLNFQNVTDYLKDLSSIGNASDSVVRELIARCYELCCSSILTLNLEDKRPERRAAFFAAAAMYPNLNRHCISIIENQLVGSSIRSAILSSVGTTCVGYISLKLVRWLLSLPDVDVNLKCPLVAPRMGAWCSPDDIGPLDHINESPLNTLLGSGLKRMDWRFNKPSWYQFLGLVSDFAFQGADLHSTLFLTIPLRCSPEAYAPGDYPWPDPHMDHCGCFQSAGTLHIKWVSVRNRAHDGILCVVAVQATTVIRRMLASSPVTSTGHNILNENRYGLREGDYSASEIETARQFLSQRCQEDGCGANDRVVGFLQPCGNLRDMPYRQVNEQDSDQIMEMFLKYIFEDYCHYNDLQAACREAVTRSPFSSIGFRDYLMNMGCFDEVAAQKLLLEYKKRYSKIIDRIYFKYWQQLMTRRR